jgi:hypothetical protein
VHRPAIILTEQKPEARRRCALPLSNRGAAAKRARYLSKTASLLSANGVFSIFTKMPISYFYVDNAIFTINVFGLRSLLQLSRGAANMLVSEVIDTAAASLIKATFEQVAREQGKELRSLVDGMVVLESGLDSLCLAVIVSRLADDFGVDPFSADEGFQFPVTLGDFIKLYVNASK